MTFETLRDQLESLTDVVRDAEARLLSDSRVSDAGDLERRARALCDDILRGEAHVAKAVQPYMAGLIAALDSYAGALSDFKDRKK